MPAVGRALPCMSAIHGPPAARHWCAARPPLFSPSPLPPRCQPFSCDTHPCLATALALPALLHAPAQPRGIAPRLPARRLPGLNGAGRRGRAALPARMRQCNPDEQQGRHRPGRAPGSARRTGLHCGAPERRRRANQHTGGPARAPVEPHRHMDRDGSDSAGRLQSLRRAWGTAAAAAAAGRWAVQDDARTVSVRSLARSERFMAR